MAGESRSSSLRDLLITTKDGDWGKDQAEDGKVPYRVIRGADFPSVRVGDVTEIPRCYLKSESVHRRTLQADDIIIETAGGNRDRPTGRTLLVTQRLLDSLDLPATCASFCRFLRVNPEAAEPRFVFWYLQWLYAGGAMWEHQVQHTGVARFQYTRFAETTPIPLPQRSTQRAISCILGAFDDKIELNRRMNRTLEAMARAIFQSWFVDFDPVCAKAAGRQPAGLSPQLAELFPDAFENSELGEIPKGWQVTSMGREATANKGLSYKGQHLCDAGEGLPMHNLNSVYEGGGYKHEGLKWYNGEYRPAHLLEPGDVIVTNTEQGFDHLLIGFAAIVTERYGPKGLFSHHIYRLRPKPTSYLPPWFLYLLLRTTRFHDLVAGHSNGTTVNMLPADGLQKPRFVVPPEPLVDEFGGLFTPLQRRLDGLYDENNTLAALCDALLPKLISGELRVPDTERIVGRAV